MDYETLLIVQGAVLAVSVVAVLVAWRQDAALPGVGEYALGTALLAAAMIVRAVFAPGSPNFAGAASNTTLFFGFVLLRFGLLRLLGRTPPPYWPAAVLIAVLAAWTIHVSLGDLHEGRYWRILIFSSYMAAISILIAIDQRQSPAGLARGPRLFVAAAFALTGLANAVRGLWVVFDPETQVLEFPSSYEVVYRLITILSSVAITAGVVLLMIGRLIGRLDAQASNDPLTGVLNRRGFNTQSRAALARILRRKSPAALFVTDLDLFKRINDQYGHAVGDLVLREFAQVARASLRTEDLLARFGGEEFVVLLEEGGPEQAGRVAERLRRNWAEHEIRYPAGVLRSTVSIGVAPVDPGSTQSVDDAYRLADEALYRAKEAGRNRVELAQTATGHQGAPAAHVA